MMTWLPVWCQSNLHGTIFLPWKNKKIDQLIEYTNKFRIVNHTVRIKHRRPCPPCATDAFLLSIPLVREKCWSQRFSSCSSSSISSLGDPNIHEHIRADKSRNLTHGNVTFFQRTKQGQLSIQVCYIPFQKIASLCLLLKSSLMTDRGLNSLAVTNLVR